MPVSRAPRSLRFLSRRRTGETRAIPRQRRNASGGRGGFPNRSVFPVRSPGHSPAGAPQRGGRLSGLCRPCGKGMRNGSNDCPGIPRPVPGRLSRPAAGPAGVRALALTTAPPARRQCRWLKARMAVRGEVHQRCDPAHAREEPGSPAEQPRPPAAGPQPSTAEHDQGRSRTHAYSAKPPQGISANTGVVDEGVGVGAFARGWRG